MEDEPPNIILASRSPRRRELLQQLIPAARIDVSPPTSADEAGFENLHDWPSIETRLRDIARAKCRDVQEQCRQRKSGSPAAIIAADTTIAAHDATGRLIVLGQPPDEDWENVVRHWFRAYYAGRTHVALTGVCVADREGQLHERVVKSSVTFRPDVERWLGWYVATSEPRGKAGGYALQGAGSVFITRVEGSLSNVVGLPLEELQDILAGLRIISGAELHDGR